MGRKFTFIADHEPLNWMHSRKDPGQRLMRWMFKFTGYEYTFKFKSGKLNCNADALSRNPIDEPSEEVVKADSKAGYNQLQIHKIHQLEERGDQ